jgi:hypothetical protein
MKNWLRFFLATADWTDIIYGLRGGRSVLFGLRRPGSGTEEPAAATEESVTQETTVASDETGSGVLQIVDTAEDGTGTTGAAETDTLDVSRGGSYNSGRK